MYIYMRYIYRCVCVFMFLYSIVSIYCRTAVVGALISQNRATVYDTQTTDAKTPASLSSISTPDQLPNECDIQSLIYTNVNEVCYI